MTIRLKFTGTRESSIPNNRGAMKVAVKASSAPCRARPQFSLLLLLLLLGGVPRPAHGDKDDSYYTPGTGNPNVDETMYWKDAENVLQDLQKFSSLHVVFHQCAWTWMQPADSGNSVDENDYWYMGKIPPMGANVAFSLYGSLTGRTFGGCNADTFINSFYTKTGFEVFATAMQNAGVSGFGAYSYGSSSGSSSYLTSSCLGYSGVGCNTNYGFAVHSYSTALCDPQTAKGVTDQLVYLNQAMQASQCIRIYSSSSSYSTSYSNYYSNNNQGDGDNNANNNNANNNNNGNSNAAVNSDSPLNLLSYSSACFYQNFWSPDGECPDPYGKIKNYQNNFYKGIQRSKMQRPVAVYKQQQIYEAEIIKGQSRLVFGVVCAASAIFMLILDKIWSWCRRRREAQRAAQKAAETASSVGSTYQSSPTHQGGLEDGDRPYR
jgi:hypothetical protein